MSTCTEVVDIYHHRTAVQWYSRSGGISINPPAQRLHHCTCKLHLENGRQKSDGPATYPVSPSRGSGLVLVYRALNANESLR